MSTELAFILVKCALVVDLHKVEGLPSLYVSKYFYTFHDVINLFSWIGIIGLRVPRGPWFQIYWVEMKSKIKDSTALHPSLNATALLGLWHTHAVPRRCMPSFATKRGFS